MALAGDLGHSSTRAPATGAQSRRERTVPVSTCPLPTTARTGAPGR
jgi:hypothetical protein